jgi:hypothetical protein
MGILDEAPNYAAQAQLWQNYWANEEKQQAQRTAGPLAASGDWAAAQRAALQRGQLPLYQDLQTLHDQSQAKLAQQVLDATQAAKTPQQYHAILDTLSQHGVPGLSKYRVPANGDFETTKAATLAEFGKYNDYIKAQQAAAAEQRRESEMQLRWAQERRAAAEAAKSKATYLGTIAQPGVTQEATPAMPKVPEGTQAMWGIKPLRSDLGAPSSAATIVDPSVSYAADPEGARATIPGAAIAYPDNGPTSLSQMMLAPSGPTTGLGQETPTPTVAKEGSERKSMVFADESGNVRYEPLPEGAEFEGKGNKAKQTRDEFWTDFYKQYYPNMSPQDRANAVKHQIDKESGQIQVMHALQAPEAEKNKEALQEAAEIRASGQKTKEQKLADEYQDIHHGSTREEALNWVKDFLTKEPPTEIERNRIMKDHPGETYEQAMMRGAAAKGLQTLTQDPNTKAWTATPVTGSLNLRKLDEKRTSDLQLVRNDLLKDPANAGMSAAQADAAAKQILRQSGYNVEADSDGTLHYTVADNSSAAVTKQRADAATMMSNLHQRVATDPTLAAQMSWAKEATKQNVKTEGRENQTYIVDAHVDGIRDLAGGPDYEHVTDPQKRKDLDQALGFLHSKLGYRIWVGEVMPSSGVPPAAMSLISYKKALQAETGRLLSMGMTSNIAHEHQKELGEVVGELQEVPTVENLYKQLNTVKGITTAIRKLPPIPTDPIEAQKHISERLAEGRPIASSPKDVLSQVPVPNVPITASDGHQYWKVLSPDGAKAEWKRVD